MKVAVMGYGTIGSGVVEILRVNRDVVANRAGETLEVTKILDLRDFEGDPVQNLIVHDYKEIVNDPEIASVVETMGGFLNVIKDILGFPCGSDCKAKDILYSRVFMVHFSLNSSGPKFNLPSLNFSRTLGWDHTI